MSAITGRRYLAVELDGTARTVGGVVEVDAALAGLLAGAADETAFRSAMSRLAAGVVMVTAWIDGRPWGLTVSACCSVSLEPPQVLVSLSSDTATCRHVRTHRTFGVDILAASQQPLAELGSRVGVAKFIDDYCTSSDAGDLGAPIIAGALAHLDCVAKEMYDASDHTLIVGQVTRVVADREAGEGDPLLYFNRNFHQLGDVVP